MLFISSIGRTNSTQICSPQIFRSGKFASEWSQPQQLGDATEYVQNERETNAAKLNPRQVQYGFRLLILGRCRTPSTVMPGFSLRSGCVRSTRTLIVPVSGSTCGSMNVILPIKPSRGYASAVTSTSWPRRTDPMSDSETCNCAHKRVASAIVNRWLSLATRAPSSACFAVAIPPAGA
jgi:hypothetical protein